MKKHLLAVCRLFLVLSVLAISSWPVSALAINAPSGTFQIDNVDVYEHNLETNDQLWIIRFTNIYAVNPAESITDAYLLRIVNTTTLVEYGQVQPYNYYNKGYGNVAQRWIASIYIPASAAPTWGSTGYTLRFEGNPTLSWSGAIPLQQVIGSAITWHTTTDSAATKIVLASWLRTLAFNLETDWPVFDMIEGGFLTSSKLTQTGVDYFTNVIANLYTICPDIMPSSLNKPSDFAIREKAFTKSRSNALEGRSLGPTLDAFFNLRLFGLSPLLFKSIIAFGIIGVVAGFISWKAGNPKPALFAVLPLGLAFAYISMGSIIFWAILAIMAVMLFVFTFMLKRAG